MLRPSVSRVQSVSSWGAPELLSMQPPPFCSRDEEHITALPPLMGCGRDRKVAIQNTAWTIRFISS